jgi:hypothetical protein
MSSSSVTKQSGKDISQPAKGGCLEAREQNASASANVCLCSLTSAFSRKSRKLTMAQAGLNLNIFGALSGAFSSKSKKQTEADGSSLEYGEENAHVKGESGPARS